MAKRLFRADSSKQLRYKINEKTQFLLNDEPVDSAVRCSLVGEVRSLQ